MDMTIASFNVCAGLEEAVPQEKKEKKSFNPSLDMCFIEYLENTIEAEDIRIGTRKHKKCVVDALKSFGKIKKLSDLTAYPFTAFAIIRRFRNMQIQRTQSKNNANVCAKTEPHGSEELFQRRE